MALSPVEKNSVLAVVGRLEPTYQALNRCEINAQEPLGCIDALIAAKQALASEKDNLPETVKVLFSTLDEGFEGIKEAVLEGQTVCLSITKEQLTNLSEAFGILMGKLQNLLSDN